MSRAGCSSEVEKQHCPPSQRRTLSELALLRGDLANALEHMQAAVRLQGSIDITAHVDDLHRASRILAAQGDLAGARRDLVEALSVAEKIGAHGQIAQSRLGLLIETCCSVRFLDDFHSYNFSTGRNG